MRGGRARLPVLAEISGPVGEDRVWSLRGGDLARLSEVRESLDGRGAVLVTGAEAAARILAVGLSGVAGAAGLRTVLLECDLARPRLATDLGVATAPGLHENLRGEAAPEAILQPLTLAGPAAAPGAQPLVCIAAGRPADDPAALICLPGFGEMVAKLRRAYDLVVIRGPSIYSGDTSLGVLAAEADGLLVGVSAQSSTRRAGRLLRAAVGRLPVAALGAVLVD